MATTVANLEAVFTANTTAFDRGIDHVDRSLSNTLGSMGRNMTQLGAGITAMTAPLVAGFGGAIATAIQFESAFAGVVKTVDATDTELENLRTTIRKMATASDNPLAGMDDAAVTLAKIMELGGQLGVPLNNLEGFAQVIGELSISTDLTAENAATMIAQFANITGMDFKDLRKFGDTVVTLGNNSATTESAVMTLAMRIAAAGSNAGLKNDEILAFATAMSSLGLEAEAAGSNFSLFLNTMATGVAAGGPKLQTFADVAGVSAEEFAKSWRENPSQAITEFIEGLGDMDQAARLDALDELGLSGLRVTDVLGRLANNSDLVTDSLTLASEAWEGNNALAIEAGKRFETTESKINRVKNQIKELGISIGEALLPKLRQFLDVVSPIITQVTLWAQANPELVGQIATLTVATTTLGIGLTVLGIAVTAIGAGLGALGVVMGLLLTPIGALVVGSGLLYAAWQTNFGGIQDAVETSVTAITTALQTARDAVSLFVNYDYTGSMLTTLGQEDGPIVDSILDLRDRFDDMVEGVTTSFSNLDTTVIGFKDKFTSNFHLTAQEVDTAIRAISLTLGLISGPVGMLISGSYLLYNAWQSNFMGIRDKVEEAVGKIKTALENGLPAVLKLMQDTGKDLLNRIKEGLGDIGPWVTDNIITPFVDFLTGGATDIAGGTDNWGPELLTKVEAGVQALAFFIGELPGKLGALLVQGLPVFVDGVIKYGPDLLAKIIETLGDIALWVATNIVAPFVGGLLSGAADFVEAVATYGPGVLTKILEGLGDLPQWIVDNVITPLAQRLFSGASEIAESVVTYAPDLLGKIIEGLGDLAAWVLTNIITPMVNKLLELPGDAAEAVANFGTEIFQSILDSLPDIGAWVDQNIIAPIESAINSIDISIPNPFSGGRTQGAPEGLLDTPSEAPMALGTGLPNNPGAPGNQAGTHWTGFGALNEVAGVVHRQEAVVPAHGMRVIPSPRGLMLEGGMGGGGGQPIYVNIENLMARDIWDLYDQLQRIGRQRAG